MSSKSKSTAHPAHPSTGDPDLHLDQDHPHACLNGYVYLGCTVLEEETGQEVERVEAVPCRRCGIAGNLTPIPCAATTSEGAIIVPD